MSDSDRPRHGSQMSKERYNRGTVDEAVRNHVTEAFDVENLIGIESDEVFDTYSDGRTLGQLLDFAGCDYIVDTHTEIFGVNHREHSPRENCRFDLRTETGTAAPSEVEKIRQGVRSGCLGPRYASRLKRTDDGGVAWVRIVELPALALAMGDGLEPNKEWSDGSTSAALFDYDLLDRMGLIVYDSEGTYE